MVEPFVKLENLSALIATLETPANIT